jgi:hypothetical protein
MFNTSVRFRRSSVAALFLVLALSGCGKEKVTVYEVSQDQPQPTASADPHQHGGGTDPHGMPPAALPRIKWTKLPEGWQENPAPGPMRAASFLIKGEGDEVAELAAIPMSGMEGMDLQLVNMWRGQVKLANVTEAEADQQATAVTIGGETGKLYEMASSEPVIDATRKGRIVVGVLKRADASWFFKLAGEDALVAKAKPAMIEFLKDITFAAPEPAAMSELPAGHPPMGGSSQSAMMRAGGGDTIPPGTGDRPKWAVPASWTEVARSQFLVAKFRATGEGDAKADINVSMSGGAGGGLLMNVNRWRAQLSLNPVDQAALTKDSTAFEASGAKGVLVDFSGPESENGVASRCVAVMVPQPHDTWFYKLSGPEALVAREREAFLKFVRSVQYPDDGHAH